MSENTYLPIPKDAPFLFDFQDQPFAGDVHMEGEFLKLRDQFGLDTFVETGTCYGSTTLWAAKHFPKVYSIEKEPKYAEIAKNRLSGTSNLELWVADSAVAIVDACLHVTSSTLFFLDAHFEEHCPLLDELRAIADAKLRPVIVIHDFQVPGRPDLGYDTWEGQAFRFSWIRPYLDAIYGPNGYGHYFNNEATGAKRGVIYITPLHEPK